MWLIYPVLRCHICPLVLPLLLCKLSLHLLWTFLKDRTQETVRFHFSQSDLTFHRLRYLLQATVPHYSPCHQRAKEPGRSLGSESNFKQMCSISHEKTVFPSKVVFAQTESRQWISSINVIDNFTGKIFLKTPEKRHIVINQTTCLAPHLEPGNSVVSSKAFLTGRCSTAGGRALGY